MRNGRSNASAVGPAERTMRNAEWPNAQWPNQASADPHAVGDLYHLPGRRARREWDGSVRKYDGTKVRGEREKRPVEPRDESREPEGDKPNAEFGMRIAE